MILGNWGALGVWGGATPAVSATVTESGGAFTGSISTVKVGTRLATVSEFAPSFNSNLSASTVPAGVFSADVTEISPSFSGAISTQLTANINASTTEASPGFTSSIQASIAIQIEGNIIEYAPSFSSAVVVKTPTRWTDKVVQSSIWTEQTQTSNTWSNTI